LFVLVSAENEATYTTSQQPTTKRQWTLESLVGDIVKEEFEREGMSDYVESALQSLRNNFIINLKQWASLTDEDKKLFPVALRDILDDASLSQVEESLRNAVVDAYKKEGNESSVNGDLLLLRRNKITSLNQWASLSDEDKKNFPYGLKILLQRLCFPGSAFVWNNAVESLNLLLEMFPRKDYVPSKLITTIGLEFPVFDREEMEEQMFMETLIRYKNREEKDRNFHNIMVLAAGPGTGKSRMNMEAVGLMVLAGRRIVKRITDESEKQIVLELVGLLETGVCINVTYGNGSGISNVDNQNGLYSLGRRILFEYFVGKRMGLEEFDTLLKGNLPTLKEALSIIKEYKIRCCDYKNEQVFIFVGIDEFTKYSELARDQFKLMFNNVGSAMCDSPEGVFFQPFFTGVDYRNVEIITKSMHTHIYLIPSLLRYQSMASIVDYMAEKHVCLKNWRVSRHFKRMMVDVGGHPRAFEYFLEECLKECNYYQKNIAQVLSSIDSADALWHTVVERVKNKYIFPDEAYKAMERCMIYSFLEEEVTMDEELKVLFLGGLITLKSKRSFDMFRVQLPLIWFYVFRNQLRFSNVMKAIEPFLSPIVQYFEQFEKFVVDFNILMNNLRVIRGIENIALEEQLRGAIFQNEQMKDWKIQIQEMKLCYSKKQYKGKGDIVIDRESNQAIDWRNGKYFVLNAPRSPFADIFCTFHLDEKSSSSNNAIALLGQVKHRDPKAVTKNKALTRQQIEKEHKKAAEKLDRSVFKDYVFVMYTMDDLEQSLAENGSILPKNTAVICKSNFSKYFGDILSTRAELEYVGNPICYPNYDSFTEMMSVLNHEQLCETITEQRKQKPFKNYQDFKERITSGLNKNNIIHFIVDQEDLFQF